MEVEEVETQLIAYLQNILKYQIIPMDFMELRSLIGESPNALKFNEFLQEHYPDAQFLKFLQNYPQTFILTPDQKVILKGNAFTRHFDPNLPQPHKMADEIDGKNSREYISGSSDSEED